MLIRTPQPPGKIYTQLTQAPVDSYADFLNWFRQGQTVDENTHLTNPQTIQNAMLRIAVASGHLGKAKNMTMPNESLADIILTKPGKDFIQNVFDRTFCQMAIAEARKSIQEDDGKPHPAVGVVIVNQDGNVISTGFRGQSGKGDHGEFGAIKALSPEDPDKVDLTGCTVYTTLEPCSKRKAPKKPCTERLINGKAARVVYGMADKHESVYGHSTLVEARIEIGFFPNDLMPELLEFNQEWSDSLRTTPVIPSNNTSPAAYVIYYKPGTSMADNITFFVRPPDGAGRPYTMEDAARNVLASGKTVEDISVEWKTFDARKVGPEGYKRQNVYSSRNLLSLP